MLKQYWPIYAVLFVLLALLATQIALDVKKDTINIEDNNANTEPVNAINDITSTEATNIDITQTDNIQNTMNQDNGLQIVDTVVGTGKEATKGSMLVVNYTGKFTDGRVFDSSIPRGQPFNFRLGQDAVIEGWHLGFEGMKVGGKRTLTIPPELAYGPNDYSSIPGGSTLIFDVELLDVK